MNSEIYKISTIGSGSLSAMAKPGSDECIDGEFRQFSQFELIRKQGIDRIVSLLEPGEAQVLGLDQEQFLANKYDMEFVSFPIRDMGLPDSEEHYLKFCKRLYQEAADGLHTVVHCRAGIGRTGMVTAGVLFYCGFEPLDAISHISNKRGEKVPDTQEQIDWIVKCHASMQSQFTRQSGI